MRLKNLHFLSRSNIKGNKSSGTVTLLVCLLVISVAVISCFAETTMSSMSLYKEDYRSRSLFLTGWAKALTDEALEAIESLEHVEVVADHVGIEDNYLFEIANIDDKEIQSKSEVIGTYMHIDRLHEKEGKQVVNGENLDRKANFTCLIPSIFYPYADDGDTKDLDYIDGRTLIGKTLTLVGSDGVLGLQYEHSTETNSTDYTTLLSPTFTFEIVGTYNCSYEVSGSFRSIYVSGETYNMMTKMAMEKSGVDLDSTTDPIAIWWRTPSLHYHYVVVDDYDNIDEIVNIVRKEMGYNISTEPESYLDPTTLLLSNIFKTVGTFLILSIMIISVFLLVQSSINSIRDRKGVIGLMKAIGYKNHQIFASLIYEQLYMTLRAFLIGGAISTLIVFFANLKFEHGTYRQMQYIIDWKVFGFFLLISLLIAVLVPLITQLILLKKLTKIQPREAMSVK